MSLNALFLVPVLATAPYALIETRDIRGADIQSFKLYIRAVDGKAYWDGPDEMKLTPGVHWLVMARERSGSKAMGRKSDEQSLYIMAKPCFRYLVAGKAEGDANSPGSNFHPKWAVHVLSEEKISYCKTREEQEQEKKDKKAARIKKVSEAKTAVTDISPEGAKTDD